MQCIIEHFTQFLGVYLQEPIADDETPLFLQNDGLMQSLFFPFIQSLLAGTPLFYDEV